MKPKAEKHKKPGHSGGTLIRKLIKQLKNCGIPYPFSAPVFVAFSGGPDSLALASLLSKYGKKVIPDPELLTLLYLEHGWKTPTETRKAQSKVKDLAKKLKLKLHIEELKPRSEYPPRSSPESVARDLRNEVFARITKSGAMVLTAHHADDLAETLVWRFFTGTLKTHPEGIRAWKDGILRPLLACRKSELIQFLKEERLTPLQDPANEELNYLRVKIRKKIMPEVEAVFPRAIENLVEEAFRSRSVVVADLAQPTRLVAELARPFGIQLRKSHHKSIQTLVSKSIGQLSLPGGWTLSWIEASRELKLTRSKT